MEERLALGIVEEDQRSAQILVKLRPKQRFRPPTIRHRDVGHPGHSLEGARITGGTTIGIGRKVSLSEDVFLHGVIGHGTIGEGKLRCQFPPSQFLVLGFDRNKFLALLLLPPVQKLPEGQGGVVAAADEIHNPQIVIILAQEGPQRGHLARCSADQDRTTRGDRLLDGAIEALRIALRIFGATQPRQIVLLVRNHLMDGEVLSPDGTTHKAALAVNHIRQRRKGSAGGAVETNRQILVDGSKRFRLRPLIALQRLRMELRADLLAQAAIDTLRPIDRRIKEALLVGLERDGTLRAHIATCVTPATSLLILDFNHDEYLNCP